MGPLAVKLVQGTLRGARRSGVKFRQHMAMRIGIVGLGLMGASFALALRAARPEVELVGADSDPATMRRALARGLVAAGDLAAADVVVIAAPIPALPEVLAGLAGHPGVVTDMASTKVRVYVSPFVGRLDDIGENGVDLVANIKRMYADGDGHVAVLAASIRNLEQLLYCFSLETDLVTVPARVLDNWARHGFPMPDDNFKYTATGKPILYREVVLDQPWQSFDIQHELTRKGIEKFVADYRATLSQTT